MTAMPSPESQALHDGFEQHVLPVLAPLGFARVDPGPESRGVGWTALAAECVLPSGARLTADLACFGKTSVRFQLAGASGPIELMCTETDPAYPQRTTVSHSLSYFEAIGDAARGGEVLAARRLMALEFLALEIAACADQLVAAVPEMRPLVEAARQTPAWRDAAGRAHALWANRNVRSGVEDRPVEGTFQFVGAGLVVVLVESERFTFRFDTSSIDRTLRPIVSGWWTTAAGTRKPSKLVVGDVTMSFDPTGKLVGP